MIAHRDLLQRIEQVPVMLSQGAISIGENNFTESIPCEPRGLSAQNTARIESVNWPQKKICWMKKNPVGNGMTGAPIDTHRANHPNQLVIRGRISDPEFRF
jgi:hypothetical protein